MLLDELEEDLLLDELEVDLLLDELEEDLLLDELEVDLLLDELEVDLLVDALEVDLLLEELEDVFLLTEEVEFPPPVDLEAVEEAEEVVFTVVVLVETVFVLAFAAAVATFELEEEFAVVNLLEEELVVDFVEEVDDDFDADTDDTADLTVFAALLTVDFTVFAADLTFDVTLLRSDIETSINYNSLKVLSKIPNETLVRNHKY